MNEIEKGTTAYFIERIAALEAQAAEAQMLANQLGIAHLRIQTLEARLGQLLMALKDYKKHGEWCLVERAALAATEPKP